MAEIHLSDDHKAFIEDLVKSGAYKNEDEVVAAGLRLLQQKDANLRKLIQEGLDDVEAGRVLSFASSEELTAHIMKMAEERKNAVAPARGIAEGAGRSSRRL
ncbi:type II toxin-antitoxin system ParD family antitoxin [Neorhizobium lilium]|uniref:Type II toxin-antitoxin system ParD family antitoxin n=1 Tax=Neorhizobium lilium TaxID=2503024 RepID=A0A444LDH0_9HYPH|nr:type II toxin-antitoxin system ParD family antitoxin [Neorhizobium lilium]RWX75893.1 type II toxin-antitoxin system ParD family antitoxin [Neorhizobium lilium]